MIQVLAATRREGRTPGGLRLSLDLAALKLAAMGSLRSLDEIARSLEGISSGGAAPAAPRGARSSRPKANPGPAATEAAPVAKPPEGPITPEAVTERWEAILQAVRGVTRPWLRPAVVAEAMDDRVVLAFTRGHEWQRDNLRRAMPRREVEEALKKVLGSEVAVEISAEPAGEGGATDGPTEERISQAERERVMRESMVTKAADLFDARVTDVRRLPRRSEGAR
jgi:hypothetical protein